MCNSSVEIIPVMSFNKVVVGVCAKQCIREAGGIPFEFNKFG